MSYQFSRERYKRRVNWYTQVRLPDRAPEILRDAGRRMERSGERVCGPSGLDRPEYGSMTRREARPHRGGEPG